MPAAAPRERDVASAVPRPVSAAPVVAPVVMTGTEQLDLGRMRAALAQGAVPFSGTTSPERLAALRKSSATVEADPTVAADAESTMFMPTAASRAIASEAADFARDLRAVPIPDLSPDHFAALSVEVELKGALPEVLRRHGVPSPASFRALEAEQARLMMNDPARRARYEERRAHFMSFAKGGS